MSVTTKRDLQAKVSSLTVRLNQLHLDGASDEEISVIEGQLSVAMAELENFIEDIRPTPTSPKKPSPGMR